ncbi:MAG: DPP IV N-terminal domain-containing protein [Cyclobacterium sp.]|nr:DPP IV N-terminal domain-containing protein [Cyclobacterium sp.]
MFLYQGLLLSPIAYSQSNFSQSHSSTIVPDNAKERLKEIYEENIFSVNSFNGSWLPDGSGYLDLEDLPGQDTQALVRYDVYSGQRTVLLSKANFDGQGYTGRFKIKNYVLSSDGDRILVELSSKEEDDSKPDYWMLERKTGDLEKIVAGTNNSISPDGKQILYAEKGDLYMYHLVNEKITQLTNDAVAQTISNARAVWSPDGKRIAFVQSDASDVRKRSSLIPGDPSYPEVIEQRFARVGGAISKLRVGILDIEGKETRWLSIPMPKEGYYLGEVAWAGNSEEVLLEKRSRFRDERKFLMANVNNGKVTTIYEEADPAWVVASYRTNGGVDWVHDYSNFIVLSEKDGWRHAYLCSREGKKEVLLTSGDYDVIGRAGLDENKGWFYYYASPDNGTQKYLYRTRIDGKGKAERITPMDQPGTHTYNISPDGQWAFHTYSTANTPPVTELVSLPDHKVERVLEENDELHGRIKELDFQPKEFFNLDIGNGVVMDAWMIKPRDFDPSKKYPVFVYVYGEPHGQTVMDSWGHAMTDFHRVIADLGYLVVSIDNRGTPCPKGAAWRRAVAGSLGPLSTEEQAAGLQELGRTYNYGDLDRVGIWGWSGGGSNTLNAMFRKPELYKVGIAVAPKPQPQLYNAWFQEIYMNTPEVNPEGYRESAPINFAEGLKGDLLIIHGTGETNTHIEITEGLVDRLIELGKPFDYMAYPNRDHGLNEGKGTPVHMRLHLLRYLLSHLPPGGR